MKIVEIVTKDLKFYINFLIRAAAGFEKIDSNFESSPEGEMLSNSISCCRQIVHERKGKLV